MKKIIKNEDLKNVNGGEAFEKSGVTCPKCNCQFYKEIEEGEGCDVRLRLVCDDCGYEWYS